MRSNHGGSGYAAVIATVASFMLSATLAAQGIVSLDEAGMRQLARRAPAPVYPASSIANKNTGVAVAQVLVTNGRDENVNILEAPDEEIGRAVRAAVAKWEFGSVVTVGTTPKQARGKLIFYFRLVNGTPRVLTPQEALGETRKATSGDQPPSPRGSPPAVPMSSHDRPSPVADVGPAELANLIRAERAQVIDVRDRAAYRHGHRDGSVNIPIDELAARGRAELLTARPVVVDCSNEIQENCLNAVHVLKSLGYQRMAIFRGK